MPAQIDETTGEVAFVYNQQNGNPWHESGTPVDGAMTGDELFERCPAFAFECEKRTVFYQSGTTSLGEPIKSLDPDHVAVVRTDTGAMLGLVSPSYSLFQNRELTQFADAVRGESDAAYDTAGALFDGKVVFVQLILGEDYRIDGDPSDWQRRLLVWTGHDGRHSLVAKRTNIRVVCANTHEYAMVGPGASYSIRHTANMDVAVEDARRALALVNKYDRSFAEAMQALAGEQISTAEVEAFIESLLPISPDVENPWRTESQRNTLRALIDASPTLVGVPTTKYRVLQAVGEWTDHYRTYRTKAGDGFDARVASIIEGSASATKGRALGLLLPR